MMDVKDDRRREALKQSIDLIKERRNTVQPDRKTALEAINISGSDEQREEVINMLSDNSEIDLSGVKNIEVIEGSEAPLVSRVNGTLKLHSAALNNPIVADIAVLALNGKDGADKQVANIVNRIKEIDAPTGVNRLDRVTNIVNTGVTDKVAVEFAVSIELIRPAKETKYTESSSPAVESDYRPQTTNCLQGVHSC